MNPRVLMAVGLVTALAFAALVVGFVTRDTGSGGGDATAQGVIAQGSAFQGARIPKGVRAPDFRLRDEQGKPIRMSDFRGKPVVVTFLYTHCRDTCPATAQQVRGALDKLGHDVPAIAVSVDPPNDTPESARRFLSEQHVLGRVRFALGDRAALKRVWDGYAINPQSARQEHQARLVIVDAEGRQRIGFPLQETTPEMIAHDLAVLEKTG
jgi:protein SCO1/2